jgi:hypothetical protein
MSGRNAVPERCGSVDSGTHHAYPSPSCCSGATVGERRAVIAPDATTRAAVRVNRPLQWG